MQKRRPEVNTIKNACMPPETVPTYTPTKRSDAQPLECDILTMGCEKTKIDAIKFSYHFYYLMLNRIFLALSTKIFRILHKLDENNHLNSSC